MYARGVSARRPGGGQLHRERLPHREAGPASRAERSRRRQAGCDAAQPRRRDLRRGAGAERGARPPGGAWRPGEPGRQELRGDVPPPLALQGTGHALHALASGRQEPARDRPGQVSRPVLSGRRDRRHGADHDRAGDPVPQRAHRPHAHLRQHPRPGAAGGRGRTFAITHYDLWHGTAANKSDKAAPHGEVPVLAHGAQRAGHLEARSRVHEPGCATGTCASRRPTRSTSSPSPTR